jgi:hypothetical protein
MGGGRNIKNQNVEGSECRKFFWMVRTSKVIRSECQKSLCQKERQKSEKLDFQHSDLFWRHRYYQNVERLIWRKYFWCSDFTYGIRKVQNVKSLICLIFKFWRKLFLVIKYLWRMYQWHFAVKKAILKKLSNLS